MGSVGSRVFNLVGDKYLSFGNEEWVRTLAIGSDWTRLRLGMLAALTPDGTNNLNGCRLVWGLCSGKTNPFGDVNTTNFLGMNFGSSVSSDTLTYVDNGGEPYLWSGRSILRRVNGVTSITGGNGLEFHRIATNTGTTQRRGIHFVEITKGSPNFTVRYWGSSAAEVAKDYTPAHLMDGLEQDGSIMVNGEDLGAGIAVTMAFDEVAGALDSVDLFWNKSAFPIELYAMGVHRFS